MVSSTTFTLFSQLNLMFLWLVNFPFHLILYQLISLAESSNILGSCEMLNVVHLFFIFYYFFILIVLGWQNTCESVDNITATLAALSTKIDISVLYHCGLDEKGTHCLVSMVCSSLFLHSFYFLYFTFARLSSAVGAFFLCIRHIIFKQSIGLI